MDELNIIKLMIGRSREYREIFKLLGSKQEVLEQKKYLEKNNFEVIQQDNFWGLMTKSEFYDAVEIICKNKICGFENYKKWLDNGKLKFWLGSSYYFGVKY